jgi:glycosyltransferase involved in cell wall biosynthesis/SAM-dependent methyltransferase/uncharacterized protein YbaR (Trm112 family)
VIAVRLLFPIHYPVFGGPHNQALRLAQALDVHGWATTVVLPDDPGNAAGRLRSAGLDVVMMPLHRLRATTSLREQAALLARFWTEVRALRGLIRERGIDVVQVAGLVNPHAALAARAEDVPVVWQLVDGRTPAVLRRMLTPVVGRLADVLMFTGQRIAELHTDGVLPRQTSLVFYPPVDPDIFRPRPELRAQARTALGIPEAGAVIGMVANFNPQKGVEDFVRAAAQVVQAVPGCHFVAVGATYATHARYERTVRDLADSLGLTKHLTFAGARDDVELVYQAMDIKMITSVPRSEGATTAAIEAMACGVPVVTTDVGAVREVIADGETGLLVPPRQPTALAAAVVRLLKDSELRTAMGAAARARVETRLAIDRCIEVHLRAYEAAVAARPRPARVVGTDLDSGSSSCTAVISARPDPLDQLQALLRCPACRGGLAWSPHSVECCGCGLHYTVTDGVPVLLLDNSDADHDELDHDHGHGGHGVPAGHAARQAAWFDRGVLEAFEIRRPHGTPAFHAWLLGEKMRRALRGIATVMPGGTALTVCGGSGMDAEYLARAGAAVIASDISLGAARRTAERARRSMLPILPVVAAIERLPFADRAVDLVLVHDGLHHLELPMEGLCEMARVAGRAVSITEPAKAAATTVAVRLGLADEIEESGNRVARLRPRDLSEALERDGLHVKFAERYAMYYRHQPGRASRVLSLAGPLPGATAWRAANMAFGRIGNKLTVTALRPPDGDSVVGS